MNDLKYGDIARFVVRMLTLYEEAERIDSTIYFEYVKNEMYELCDELYKKCEKK